MFDLTTDMCACVMLGGCAGVYRRTGHSRGDQGSTPSKGQLGDAMILYLVSAFFDLIAVLTESRRDGDRGFTTLVLLLF